jgi:hypothetical protein
MKIDKSICIATTLEDYAKESQLRVYLHSVFLDEYGGKRCMCEIVYNSETFTIARMEEDLFVVTFGDNDLYVTTSVDEVFDFIKAPYDISGRGLRYSGL